MVLTSVEEFFLVVIYNFVVLEIGFVISQFVLPARSKSEPG